MLLGNTTKSNLNRLFLIQKKAIRIISGSKFLDHTEPLFTHLKLLPLEKMIELRVSIFMYKHYNASLPENLSTLFVKNSASLKAKLIF